jgi:hypothetical protein
MVILYFIFHYGIWISIPAFILFVTLLVYCIAGVVRTIRQTRLFSVPLLSQQEIEISQTGEVILCMEGPMFSRRFAHLDYELIGPDGTSVKGRNTLFRATSSGFTKAKMELRVYEISTPGRHLFLIRGLGDERPSDAEHQMVFTRPHLARSIVYVLGIVFAGCMTIGSIVLFFLRLTVDGSAT